MANPNQDRLRTHFSNLPPSSHASGWDSLWAEGTFIPWDRGYANPALIDFLSSPHSPPLSASPNPTPGAPAPNTIDSANGKGFGNLPNSWDAREKRRKKALVPGCGKGYDVALLASYGFDSFGLEVSEHAAELANQYLSDPGQGPLEGEYATKDERIGSGQMKCLLGDFFEDGWLKEAGGEGGFDIIYDNTVCGGLEDCGGTRLIHEYSFYVLYRLLCDRDGRRE
jgi:hypothetical protein